MKIKLTYSCCSKSLDDNLCIASHTCVLSWPLLDENRQRQRHVELENQRNVVHEGFQNSTSVTRYLDRTRVTGGILNTVRKSLTNSLNIESMWSQSKSIHTGHMNNSVDWL